MRFVVAGGGVAGLASALAVARAGHSAVVLERDPVESQPTPAGVFDLERRGIPHYLQPHSFLPRGRRVLADMAPDVLQDLADAGADPQDVSLKLRGPRQPGDDDLVYLWVRRPVIEWALRRAAGAERDVEIRSGVHVTGLLTSDDGAARVVGVATDRGEPVRGDVVVDALGRYRCPPGWPRAAGTPTDSGAVYYSRYFELADGIDHMESGLLNPRGDLGYMGFNVFRGDNRTFAVIVLTPAADHDLRVLRHEAAWEAACSAIRPLDVMTSSDYGQPLTGVLPMGGLMNVDRTGDPGVAGLLAIGDALCHTDPAFAYGLSFSVAQAQALGEAASEGADPDTTVERYRAAVGPEARERHRLVCATDDSRARRWNGEPFDVGRRDGCYPLFALATAIAAAPHDDLVLRRTVGRIGLLDRTDVFDGDQELHDRIETIFARLSASSPAAPGPTRDEMLARIGAVAPA